MHRRSAASPTEANVAWFLGNTRYQHNTQSLTLYRYARMTIEHELKGCKTLLDIGNGGFFNYDVTGLELVVALDLFIDESRCYGHNVKPVRGNALDFALDERFDCIVLQNLLHHVTGTSPNEARRNVVRIMQRCAKHLARDGKVVIIESVVPAWFYAIEQLAFRALYKSWRFAHPITLQHTSGVIIKAARLAGFALEEYVVIPQGKWILQFGTVWPAALTPVRLIKLVLRLPQSGVI
jgi:SAM-dependent methyltransferase